MISPAVIDSIRELLAQRLSQRKIAERLGVSRGVVASVVEGWRPDYEAIHRRREASKQPIPMGPLERCPTCGGMVYRPCRLCALRQELAREKGDGGKGDILLFRRGTASSLVTPTAEKLNVPFFPAQRPAVDPRRIEPWGLELRGEARARYEATHQRRMQQGELADTGEAGGDDRSLAAADEDEWLEDEALWP